MKQVRARRVQVIAAAAVAAALMVGVAGCGGSSSGSEGASKTTQPSGSDKGSDSGGSAASDLPDPCDLVPLDKASEILGGEAAKPESTSSDAGVSTRTCVWQTQEGKDNPTLDGAGHLLTLNVTAPPDSMSMSDFWDASADAADEEVGVPDCSAGFWTGGMLSATTDGVYLTGSAGLADDSAEAKQSAMQLVSAACANIG